MQETVVKNLSYLAEEELVALLKFAREGGTGLSPVDSIEAAVKYTYSQYGVQLRLTERIRGELDMMQVTLEGVTEMAWPVIEVFSDNPQIPTFLLCDHTWLGRRHAMAQKQEVPENLRRPVYHLIMEQKTAGSEHNTLLLGCFSYEQAQKHLLADSKGLGSTRHLTPMEGLSLTETETMSRLLVYALKYWVAASLDVTIFTPMSRRKMSGGKPGVCQRPKRPAFYYTWMPRLDQKPKACLVTENGKILMAAADGCPNNFHSPYAWPMQLEGA